MTEQWLDVELIGYGVMFIVAALAIWALISIAGRGHGAPAESKTARGLSVSWLHGDHGAGPGAFAVDAAASPTSTHACC
jgi:hypothetical protein